MVPAVLAGRRLRRTSFLMIDAGGPQRPMQEKKSMTRQSASPTLAEGVLELEPQGNGHLRQMENNFLPGPKDVRVPNRLINKYFLKEGQFIQGPSGMARRRNNRRGGPPHRELQAVDSVNGFSLQQLRESAIN